MIDREIDIGNDEVKELLTAVPKGIIRWGNSVILVLVIIALILSFLIKYPDRLTAKTIITTKNPPVTLVSKINGKIIELKTTNNQIVKKGQVLLVIESNANYKSILSIDSILNSLHGGIISSPSGLNDLDKGIKEITALGDLTTLFIDFRLSLNEYKLQLEVSPQAKEIKLIEIEIIQYELLQVKYRNREALYYQELILLEKDFQRSEGLFKGATISAKEIEEKKREHLSMERSYEDIKIATINNILTIKGLEKNKLQLQLQDYQNSQKFQIALLQSIEALKSQIETWKRTYLLTAPIEGKISLFNYWSVNQNLRQGEEVLSIVSTEKQEMLAKLILPVKNSGKLSIGQSVNIKLDNYLYQEYGMLRGLVKSISLMPLKESYSVEVYLPNDLMTTYNKQLTYQQEMQGTADIITKDLSVFDRIFYQFRRILKKY